MSGSSRGGVDGGEPHLTTNGEVSIASEFNYDAGKYKDHDCQLVATPQNHLVYQSPIK